MKIKHRFFSALLAFFVLLNNVGYAQTLTAKAAYPATEAADGPVFFTLGNKIYVGGGFLSKKFFEYDVSSDTWVQKNDLPGVTYSRCYGTGFSVNGKGYIGLGFDLNSFNFTFVPKKDLWEYDALNDTWTQKANYPGISEDAHFSFVINNTAYVGGGEKTLGPTQSELYAYNALADTWTQKAGYPDPAGIASPFVFVQNNTAYISCGLQTDASSFFIEIKKTYAYDPAGDSWTQKSDFMGDARQGGVAFVVNNKAYCGWGYVNSIVQFYNDFFEYNSASDTWTTSITTTVTPRAYPAAQVTPAGRVFLGLGFHNIHMLYDWYEMDMTTPPTPTISTVSLPENNSGAGFELYPQPFSDHISIKGLQGPVDYTFYSLKGQMIREGRSDTPMLFTKDLPPGVYLLELKNNTSFYRRKVIKE